MFKKLFEPVAIGNMNLKNRIAMPAMHLGYATEEGSVTDRLKNFYAERARGGVGLIVVGGCFINPLGKARNNMLSICDDKFVSGYKELADAIKTYGAKICVQLFHAGGYASSQLIKMQPVAPSSLVSRLTGETPRELTVEEIQALEEEFAEGARRAKEAGVDAVELIASTGYLISEFLSPVTNKRTDRYGGNLEGRTRFLLEVIECVRKKVGNYPILCRISVDEFMKGGHTLEESKYVVRALEKAGVDAINAYAGWHESPRPLVTMHVPSGEFVYLAEAVKKLVKVPVIAGIRINDPRLADKIIEEGKADLVYMGRPLIADPELPNKAFTGRLDDIRPCIACNQGCLDRVFTNWGSDIMCCVNAVAGREQKYDIGTASKTKKVIVVGGGPGGMEAGRVTALRGHVVTLYEKNSELGGQLRLAAKPPGREEINKIVYYLSNQLRKLGVRVELNKDVDEGLIEELNPDVVIVATGAVPIIPDIKGAMELNVVHAHDVLTGKADVGQEVVVVGGGGVGCGTAEFLSQMGKNVTIAEMMDEVAADVGPTTRWVVFQRLKQRGVKILTRAKAEKITKEGIVLTRDGREELVGAETIVFAVGSQPNLEVFEKLEGKVPELYAIGDCVNPRKALDAIHEGFDVGCKV